ncbi:hypothetical protein C8T65DRAFT_736879 [Cerioporus squamosus]|nr:hypothetical protein C8T65DRAFT_736879 [Cerioporus squamosus]
MPAERTSASSSQTAFRRVKWEGRTVAVVAKPNVLSIIQAACKHFRVVAPVEEFVLLGQLDGDELTDESLDLLPSKAVLTLFKLTRAAFPIAKVEPTFANLMVPSAATTSA